MPVKTMKNNSLKKWANTPLLIIAALILTACGGGGDNDGSPPFAVAAVFGSSQTTRGMVEVRSGSTVLLSGADSDNRTFGVPIMTFEWKQIDHSGYEVALYERNRSASVFVAPLVPINDTQGVELEFELVAVDARGVRVKDTVKVLVKPIYDENHFLLNPNVDEDFILVVAAEAGLSMDTDIPFAVVMTKTAYWQDRSDRYHGLILDETTFTGIVSAGTALDPSNAGNPFYQIPFPMLDADEINSLILNQSDSGWVGYEDQASEASCSARPRSCRLELERIPGASIRLSFQLTQDIPSPSLGLYLAEPDIIGTDLTFLALASNDVHRKSLTVEDEELRVSLGVESERSAKNYYDCIDPQDNAITLQGWLEQAGFTDSNGESINHESVAHAAYLNNYDLNFGRDMFVRQDENSNVYAYVTNYPTLENVSSGRNEFAVVAMEFSPAPTGKCGDNTFDVNKKIVKYYAFVPDTTTGNFVRMPTMNFDGRGERSLPGVCVACHYGDTNTDANTNSDMNANGFNTEILSDIDASAADLDSSFMPWDLDSLLYTQSADPAFTDPVYAANTKTNTKTTAAFSREAQEDEFRRMNQMVLDTYTYDTDNLLRFETSIKMLHGWYGNKDSVEDLDFSAFDSAASLNLLFYHIGTLPDNPFNGDYIQAGWEEEEELYHQVFARNCRLCHAQLASISDPNPTINFDTYEEFITNGNLVTSVFELGRMPLSRLTYDRFWVDFYGETSGAEILRDHLNSDLESDNDVATDSRPGLPVASIVPTTTDVSIDFDGTQLFDGSGSLFADLYQWRLDSSPITNSDGSLVNTAA
ncbi:MAG: hypothetical protein ACI82Z_001998, partial [Cellvibrionaceae bacterium]